MANVAKWGIEFNPRVFDSVTQIGRVLPEVRARALGWVGARGTELLYNNFLSGQAIKLKSTRDKKGRRTVSYSVGRRAETVSISSYPMNLFEFGRLLRSGRRESGKHVITGKFRALMSSNLQSTVDAFDQKVLEGIVNGVERDIALGKEISRQGYMK
jgi:hypothetical protein